MGFFDLLDEFIDSLKEIPILQRLAYDISLIKEKKLPIIWVTGPPGSGVTTQTERIAREYDFANIKVGSMLVKETQVETDRGRIVRENLHKKLPDFVVIDLVKEEMLRTVKQTKGFVIEDFPQTRRQAKMFVKEIAKCDIVIYLTADLNYLVSRTLDKRSGGKLNNIRRYVVQKSKQIKKAVTVYSSKVEKVWTV